MRIDGVTFGNLSTETQFERRIENEGHTRALVGMHALYSSGCEPVLSICALSQYVWRFVGAPQVLGFYRCRSVLDRRTRNDKAQNELLP